jgi:uncharacterized membrane protein
MRRETHRMSQAAEASTNTKGQWLPIGLILLVATILRLYQLTTESLWVDEMISIGDAERFEFSIPYIRPLYFIVLRGWMNFGSTDAWLRGLAVLFGVGSVYVLYLLGRRIAGVSVGRGAALVMALSPLFLNHSQEIRMYTMICFLSLGGTLALTSALKNPSHASLLWWAVARSLLVVSNTNNILILLPDALLFGWKYRRQHRWLLKFGVGLVVIGLFFFPVFYTSVLKGGATTFMTKQVGAYSKPGVLQIFGMITQFAVYWPFKYLFKSAGIGQQQDQLTDSSLLGNLLTAKTIPLLFYTGVTVLLLVLLGVALLSLRRKERSERLRWIAFWALLPAASMLVISYKMSSIWFPRYLIFIVPYFLILLAEGFLLVWRWKRWLGAALVGVYCVGVSGALWDYYTTLYRNDWRGVANEIRNEETSGDIVVFHGVHSEKWKPEYSFKRYYRGNSPLYLVSVPAPGLEIDRSFVESELGELPEDCSRLWLVIWRVSHRQGREPIIRTIMGDSSINVEHRVFESMEFEPIELYVVTRD